MKYFVKFIRVVSIRIFSISLTFIVGTIFVSLSVGITETPKTYLVKAEIFENNAFTKEDCKTPNPLILMVFVDENKHIRLNGENFGTLEDTSSLEKLLSQAFMDRTSNEVLNKNLQIEKSVVVRFHRSLSYEQAIHLIEALNKSGANPVILDPDEEYCYRGGGGSGGLRQ
jgi:biopolymer transport protein ExbD